MMSMTIPARPMPADPHQRIAWLQDALDFALKQVQITLALLEYDSVIEHYRDWRVIVADILDRWQALDLLAQEVWHLGDGDPYVTGLHHFARKYADELDTVALAAFRDGPALAKQFRDHRRVYWRQYVRRLDAAQGLIFLESAEERSMLADGVLPIS